LAGRKNPKIHFFHSGGKIGKLLIISVLIFELKQSALGKRIEITLVLSVLEEDGRRNY